MRKTNRSTASRSTVSENDDEHFFNNDLIGVPYMPPDSNNSTQVGYRDENPVVYMEIATAGGRKTKTGKLSEPQNLGRLYFELRKDLVGVVN